MKVLKISRGDICVETDDGIVRLLGEAMAPQKNEEFSEYVIYKNSIRIDNDFTEIDEEFEGQVLNFLRNEFLIRKMKMIVE